MATTDPGSDGESDHGEGGAGQLPAVRRGHDQVADAGDERGADEGLAAPEAADQPVGPQAPDEEPRRAGGQEEPVGALADPPYVGGQQAPGCRPPSPGDRPGSPPSRAGAAAGGRRRGAGRPPRPRSRTPPVAALSSGSQREGMQDNTVTTASAKKGIALFMAKSHVPTTGPARCSAPASVPLSTPLACSSASDWHQLGHDRLQPRSSTSPASGVDQHDQDQERQRHPVAQNEECAGQDGERARRDSRWP